MAMDVFKNLAYGVVLLPPTPPNLGTALTLANGHGARFGAAPFSVSVWPFGVPADPTNTEIVRVTAKAGDVFTIQRQQEGTQLRTILAGDQVAQAMTTRFLTDLITDLAATMDAKIAAAVAPLSTKAYVDAQDAALRTPRVGAGTTNATMTPNADLHDIIEHYQQATALAINAPLGTPHDGQLIIIRIRDNGAAQALTWSSAYMSSTNVPLPTTTSATRLLTIGFRYHSNLYAKWQMVAFAQGEN